MEDLLPSVRAERQERLVGPSAVEPNRRAGMLCIRESRIAAPPEVVLRFHECPGALQHLIPPWERLEVVESSGSLRPGNKGVLKGRLGRVRKPQAPQVRGSASKDVVSHYTSRSICVAGFLARSLIHDPAGFLPRVHLTIGWIIRPLWVVDAAARLETIFKYHPRDLGLLCQSAWQALREMFHEVATDPSARPGAVISVQSYGDTA